MHITTLLLKPVQEVKSGTMNADRLREFRLTWVNLSLLLERLVAMPMATFYHFFVMFSMSIFSSYQVRKKILIYAYQHSSAEAILLVRCLVVVLVRAQ